MKIHEYQAKALLRDFGVEVPRGFAVFTVDDAKQAAIDLGGGTVVVKAQIHAGGRGKGGGVKVVNGPDEAHETAKQILGMQLVTHQTGPEGKEVKRLLVEEGMDIQKEYYFGIVIDRATNQPVIMASTEGGMEIEKVAAETPEKIVKEYVHPLLGLRPFQAAKIAYKLGLDAQLVRQASRMFINLFKAFEANDCSLLEINPLVVTGDGRVLALDAKINFDDNAQYRHKDSWTELRDLSEEEPLEIEASKFGLNYIKLDGNVGCMVNGAGLAMATMDIIKLAGGEPANFLDVGGGANAEGVANAFRIILSDPNVKAVLINIFGGIVRCDRIANGIIEATKQVEIKVPLVVRLEGTNAEEASKILEESGIDMIVGRGLADAAQKVVAAIQ
ncbi:MAG: ADP-forming succinate--CoA ligase subunit beta [Deltaproteobacteria bacterium]|nr:ADP-forming succinate--CoA ligase subunit beta [Candidatus Anaeroferrophillus wilburensis]MBN2890048.1 ADP-forming succinate--CoA ligase subunit beta [Deltaproteobacteria bacterium]